MLKPALLYENQLREKEITSLYDIDNMYYHGWTGGELTNIKTDNYDVHQFVSVDASDNVIGYITYNVCHASLSVDRVGIVSFDKGNLIFIKDVYQAIHDIFYKYNLNRLEWFCFADNPAIRGYRKFINRVGGKQCGYKRQCTMLLDHKLHDLVEFEILKNEFKPIKRGVYINV